MKKLVILFFIPVYLLALASPLMPLLNYSLNKDYISKNLCENKDKPTMHCKGKCYLAKKLKSQQEQEKKTPSNIKTIEEILLFCSEEHFSFSTILASTEVEKNTEYLEKSYTSPLAGIFQPPQ